MNLIGEGIITLNWLVSITSASFFTNWIIIAWTSFRFRAALKAQNDPLFTELYAWKSSAYPLAPGWLMTISVMLAASCFAMGIGDLVRTPTVLKPEFTLTDVPYRARLISMPSPSSHTSSVSSSSVSSP